MSNLDSTNDIVPTIDKITRVPGIAGNYGYTVEVTYPGEDTGTVTFIGSVYGGPIVMVMASGAQVFVSREVTDRIGSTLSPEWVRAFWGPRYRD